MGDLLKAIKDGDTKTIDSYIEEFGHDQDRLDYLIQQAIKSNNLNMVRYLLRHDISSGDIIREAFNQSNINVIQDFMDKRIFTLDEVIDLCIDYSNSIVFRSLLGELNVEKDKDMLLKRASSKSPEIVELLLEYDPSDEAINIAFSQASLVDQIDTMQILYDTGKVTEDRLKREIKYLMMDEKKGQAPHLSMISPRYRDKLRFFKKNTPQYVPDDLLTKYVDFTTIRENVFRALVLEASDKELLDVYRSVKPFPEYQEMADILKQEISERGISKWWH